MASAYPAQMEWSGSGSSSTWAEPHRRPQRLVPVPRETDAEGAALHLPITSRPDSGFHVEHPDRPTRTLVRLPGYEMAVAPAEKPSNDDIGLSCTTPHTYEKGDPPVNCLVSP